MPKSWRDICVAGLRPEKKIVAVFRVSDTRTEDRLRFPFPLFSVAVAESYHGGYWASPNVAIKDSGGNADWIGAGGSTVEEALENCLQAFMNNIGEREGLRDEDFFWSSSVDCCDGRVYPPDQG